MKVDSCRFNELTGMQVNYVTIWFEIYISYSERRKMIIFSILLKLVKRSGFQIFHFAALLRSKITEHWWVLQLHSYCRQLQHPYVRIRSTYLWHKNLTQLHKPGQVSEWYPIVKVNQLINLNYVWIIIFSSYAT